MKMMPETEAKFDSERKSCTVVIGKAVLFLGGLRQPRQISQLTPFGLIRIETLPFPIVAGTCLVMGSQLFLGFSHSNPRSCWSR